MPDRGLGQKKVVFGGIRSRRLATSRDLGDGRAGRTSTPACGPHRSATAVEHVGDAGWYASSWGGRSARAGRRRMVSSSPSSRPARSTGGAGGRRRRARGRGRWRRPWRRGWTHRPARPVRLRSDAASGRQHVDAGGQAGEESVDGLDVELVVDQLDDEAQGEVGSAPGRTGVAGTRRGRRATSRSGGGRRRSPAARMRPRTAMASMTAGFVEVPRSRGATPPSSVQAAERSVRAGRAAWSGPERATGPRSARGWPWSPGAAPAGRCGPWASCARGAARRPRPAARVRGHRSPRWCGGRARVVGEGHAVQVEDGPSSATSIPSSRQRRSAVGGLEVSAAGAVVAAVVGRRAVDAHDVVGVRDRRVRARSAGVDHVVRRAVTSARSTLVRS